MSKMIKRGSELLRISPKDSRVLEYSKNNGNNWYTRFSGSSSVGQFVDLLEYGSEILAATSDGLYYSKNDGNNWYNRCRPSNSVGQFIELSDNGSELLATTTNGLYYSKNDGNNWYRK